MKKTNKYTSLYMSTGMALGLVFGMAVFSFNNIAVGMCLGICIGICLGVGIGSTKDKKINKQLEEFGYTVKAINKTEDGYDVILADKNGGESALTVSEKVLSKEGLKVGDTVYVEEGRMEKVGE